MAGENLFANFERMRREVDELFGDVFERTGIARKRAGFSPAVDVAFAQDPPRAIVTVDLAGIEIANLAMDIDGTRLYLAGERPAAQAEGDVYQQLEIVRGPFRRIVELGQEVLADKAQARYDDGLLHIEVPLAPSHHGPTRVRIESTGEQ
jgi:HSP20 family protein